MDGIERLKLEKYSMVTFIYVRENRFTVALRSSNIEPKRLNCRIYIRVPLAQNC